MALVIGTDAYTDLATATQYLTDFGDDGAAVDLTEAHIKKATLAIDRLFGGRFRGTVTDAAQPLLFPRDAATTIPTCVAQATAELAALMKDNFDPYAQPDPLVVKQSTEVSGIKETLEYASAFAASDLYKIAVILGPVLYSGSMGFMLAEVVRG